MKEDLLLINEGQGFFKKIYRLALKTLLNDIVQDRNNSKKLTLIGFCYKKMGNRDKAISYFQKAILADRNNFSAFYQLGVCALENREDCIALNSFINAIQLNPENPHAVLYLGVSHENCDENDMALMIYKRLIETTPSYYKAYEYKSNLYLKMSHYRDAINLLGKSVKINPFSANAYYMLGYAHKMLGNISVAYKSFRKVLDYAVSDELCSETIRELRKLKNLKLSKIQEAQIRICV